MKKKIGYVGSKQERSAHFGQASIAGVEMVMLSPPASIDELVQEVEERDISALIVQLPLLWTSANVNPRPIR